MNDNIKSSIGLFVPLSSLALFIYFCLLENFLAAILAAVGGVIFWHLYSVIMESKMPDITGNVVILFGGLLAVAFFLNYGLSKNMFGGFSVNLEGTTASAVVLFFSVLLGVSLRARAAGYVEATTKEDPGFTPTVSPETVAQAQRSDADKNITEDINDNYSYYDVPEYDYPDYYDYEDSEDFGFDDEDE